MFALLNRLRGTYGFFALIAGAFVGLIAYALSGNSGLALMMTAGYILGESMGWGKWVGGIINGTQNGNYSMQEDKEGTKNGIHWLATRFYSDLGFQYQKYCITALAIRGFYWAILTILPLAVFGYIGLFESLLISAVIGVGFPLSVIIGKYTADRFSFEYGYFNMKGAWEHAEVWYGLMQDVGLLYIILSI